MNGTKRAASSPAPASAALERVARALENATRQGARFACGTSERFPLPAIAFQEQDDDDNDLALPVRKNDILKVKTRAARAQQQAWGVSGDLLVIGNTRWCAFLQERVDEMREKLGIAPTAVVEAVLDALELVETGGALPVARESRTTRVGRGSVFGALLVVLPGDFTGGEVVESATQPHSATQDQIDRVECDQDEILWRPSGRDNAYDLTFAAFYNHCSLSGQSVTSGAALCLVYDLVTTTPTDVPLFVGSSKMYDDVVASLHEYFNAATEPLAKRFKIAPDALRNINEFGTELHFAYLVESGSFDELEGRERVIAQVLQCFCKQSGGEYVLYLTDALCSRYARGIVSLPGRDCEAESEEVKVTLTLPWIKYGTDEGTNCPPVFLESSNHVAPLGLVDTLYFQPNDGTDPIVDAIVAKRHYASEATSFAMMGALVVQPASIEARQLASLPVEETIRRLRASLAESSAQLRIFWADLHCLKDLVYVIVKINDCDVFKQLLLTLHLDCRDSLCSLRNAVHHFGWDACVGTVKERVRSTPTLRGRVNLICSFIDRHMTPKQFDSLLEPLLEFYPWTDLRVAPHESLSEIDYEPERQEFNCLLLFGSLTSFEITKRLASVTDMRTMVHLVLPALAQNVTRFRATPLLRLVLVHAWKLFKPMMTTYRNTPFAAIHVVEHCRKCSELKSFLLSPATETTVRYTGSAQADHIRSVLKDATTSTGCVVVIEAVPRTDLHLTKKRVAGFELLSTFDGEVAHADHLAQRIEALLATESD